MAEGTKYNGFSGVFTPSLLTILGVIMYMRLGWIVGEAGLVAALAIIILSHVISITTGLSISSIATDKKIKTGGIYYILSRSLGMPMGGAIGIALFLGTALSISLYLIGFAESFLAVDAIREFTGLSADINGFRIVGTIVILFLVLLAFISTSLAMRMQFVILIIIALSLVSIALGFFQGSGITSHHLSLAPTGDISLEILFAVFFPAVTGFTAGVAMSGDLQNPKSDIPKGTILAISVGFIVYILLAVGMAYFIPKEDLIGDYNILTKIAWLGPLVIAGIWGATLSSALGGILGGPRILQAISKDRMAPKIFAKGYGESNEPRNALLLIFLIAEGGILIGQLNVIAGVVSMFYLASYGFINLSYVLEKWSSSDFRPSFKIHIAFGIVGFIASFAIMFKMDMVSMLVSLLVMGLLYFFLKRREIKSESGDVWQSVWTSIIRRVLASLEGNKIEERNWKPNVLLFSGGGDKRAHLLEFGKSLIGKYGILSNFDLIEKKDSKALFTKYEQAVKENEDKGVFTRRQSCNNIYQGIEMVSQTYGFSGVEPNTILMGWGRETNNPKRFVQMLRNISHLDLNILLMDYDKANGFGEKQTIDIWWRGSGSHGNLSLTLIKFLSNSEDWSQAKIRLLIVNYENHKMDMIRKRAEDYLENVRIDAELKIINNEVEQKDFYDIMKAESRKTDLVFLGIPEIEEGKELEFVKSANDLMHNIGSVILVKASTLFKNLHFGVSDEAYNNEQIQAINKKSEGNIEINWPQNIAVAHELRQVHHKLSQRFETHLSGFYQQIGDDNLLLIKKLEQDYLQTIKTIETANKKLEPKRIERLISRNRSSLLIRLNKAIESYKEEQLKEQAYIFQSHFADFIDGSKNILSEVPQHIHIQYNHSALLKSDSDTNAQKRYKRWKRLWNKDSVKYNLAFRKIIEEKWGPNFEPFLLDYFKHFGLLQVQFAIELLKLTKTIDSTLLSLIDSIKASENTDKISDLENKINKEFSKINTFNSQLFNDLTIEYYNQIGKECNQLSSLLNQVHPNSFLIQDDEEPPKKKKYSSILANIPTAWYRNQRLIYNASTTEIKLLSLKSRIKSVIYKLAEDSKQKLQNQVIDKYEDCLKQNTRIKNNSDDNTSALDINNEISNLFEESYRALNRTFANFPEQVEIFEPEKLNTFENYQFLNIESSEISAKQLIDYLIKNKIEAPLIKSHESISPQISKSISALNDAKRLINFAFDLQEQEGSSKLREEAIEDAKAKIEEELIVLKNLIHEIELDTESLFNEISQLLSYYSFVKTASNLKQYIHQQKKLNRLDKIKAKINNWKLYLKAQQANLIYTKSKALVLRKQIEEIHEIKSPVKELLDFTYQLSPNNKVMEQLPFYYKQLFRSSNIQYKDFWVGRTTEIQQAQAAFERYHSGYKGAIAVIGADGVGKSFFSYYISSISSATKIYNISPNYGKEASMADLTKAFQKTTEQSGSIEEILNRLEKNSVITLDNFELWNSPYQDKKLTEYLKSLVKKNLKRFVFILNMHEINFQQIFTSSNHSDLFLDIIKLGNVDSRTLKEIVFTRHNTSGLELKMNNKLFMELSDLKLARLFNNIHRITNGNIEASLKLWLTAINKFEDEAIGISLPQIDVTKLDSLDIDSKIILKQFTIYKRLTIAGLASLIKEDTEDVKQKIMYLERSGLLIKHKSHYQQNTYTKYYVSQYLSQKGIL